MIAWPQLIFLLTSTIGGILLAYTLHIPLALGFLLGLSYLSYLALRLKTQPQQLFLAMKNGLWRTKAVLLILILVGLIIPAWTAAGTIPLMIKLGLSILNPYYFLTSAFLITTIISLLLGTSSGALSTVGIALIGAGAVLQVPLPMAAGAVISGAFVGDRTSPLSSANQLVASCVGITKGEQSKALMPTTLVALFFSSVFFLILDNLGHWGSSTLQSGILFSHYFQLSLWLLVPPLLMISGIVLGWPIHYAFSLAIGSSLILGTIYQEILPQQWFGFLLYGYQETPLTILHSKGLLNMLPLMSLIALTGAYNGILEETKLIQPYLRKVLGDSPSLGLTTLRTCLFGLLMNLTACNQTLPIMISGTNLRPLWVEKFPLEKLSRVIADSSLVLAGLVPWNMLAILCTTILGIETMAYLPYAVFLWLLPFLTISLSFLEERKI